jgi:endo-1,4-beta-D-glucanase Y
MMWRWLSVAGVAALISCAESSGRPPGQGPGGGGGGGLGGAGGTAGGPSDGGADLTIGPSGPDGAADSGTPSQPRYLGACILPPAARAEHVQAAYAKWKTDLLTSDGAGGFLRVRRPNSAGAEVNSTVSEGIAYGMEMAVYMNDQDVFDKLWKYSQLWLNERGLMHWYINAAGTMPLGTGAATDSDEDIAFALVMADKKWGGRGTLADTYLNLAKKQIDLVWAHEVDHSRGDALTPGDQFGGAQVINISYFAPAYYRIFGQVTGKVAEWNRVVESSYQILERTLSAANGNATNGLVPAWSTPEGVPQAPSGGSFPIHHQLDSCRTPFRLAQDYCWFGEPRALAYLEKINAFHQGIGARNIVDGYDLNGAPRPQFASASQQSAAFVGPAGVGAMASARFQVLRDEAYAAVNTLGLLAGSQYYNQSWTVLSLLMMNGSFLNLTAP